MEANNQGDKKMKNNQVETPSRGRTKFNIRIRRPSAVNTSTPKSRRDGGEGSSRRAPNPFKGKSPGMWKGDKRTHSETPRKGQWERSRDRPSKKMRNPAAGVGWSPLTPTHRFEEVKEDESVKREEKKAHRRRVNRIMNQKTSKGQPLMKGRMELMLEKIKSDFEGSVSK